jgi:hypothetical protein
MLGSPHAAETKSVIKVHASIPFFDDIRYDKPYKVLRSRRPQVLNSSDSVDGAFSLVYIL